MKVYSLAVVALMGMVTETTALNLDALRKHQHHRHHRNDKALLQIQRAESARDPAKREEADASDNREDTPSL